MSRCLEAFYLFVRRPVYFVELGPGVINQLSDFVDRIGHLLVQL
jgi:hypothetical protein